MNARACVQGSARAVEATKGPDAYPGKGARIPDALRASWGEIRRKARWHLQQRRPRPPHGDHAIDYATTAAQGVLYATAIIFTIGG